MSVYGGSDFFLRFFQPKVDSGSSGASPEEYKKSGLLLEITSGIMSVLRRSLGSTVDSRPYGEMFTLCLT